MIHISGFQKLTLLDYPGEVACTVFLPGCDFRCPFCHNSALVYNSSQESYTPNDIVDYLKSRKGVITAICITGGEPTLHNVDLKPFLEKIRKNTDVKIKIDTNGSHSTLLRNLINYGLVDYVAMDIKAGIRKYRYISGIDDLPDTTVFRYMSSIRKSIDTLLKSDIDYEFRTTVVGGMHDDKDFYEIRDLIKGAKKYYLQAYKDSGDILKKDNTFYTPEKEAMLRYKEIMKDYVELVDIRGLD